MAVLGCHRCEEIRRLHFRFEGQALRCVCAVLFRKLNFPVEIIRTRPALTDVRHSWPSL